MCKSLQEDDVCVPTGKRQATDVTVCSKNSNLKTEHKSKKKN